jgi:hypothetical protein
MKEFFKVEYDQLLKKYNKILDALHKEAKAAKCKGDLWVGWDWPTLAIVKPVEYKQLKDLEKAARNVLQAARSAGLCRSVKSEAFLKH